MIRFQDLLIEAQISSDMQKKKYFHGTHSEESFNAILKEGLKPDMRSKGRGWAKPVDGRVYLTPDLGYALIYAIGGDMVGSDFNHMTQMGKEKVNYLEYMEKTQGLYAYLIVVYGNQLTDVQPDEDSVGALFEEHNGENSAPDWLQRLANKYIAPSTLKKAMDGEVSYQIKMGNVLVKRMTDDQKMELIRNGAHIANRGIVMPDEAWRFPIRRNQELKKDGSNFFKLAERVK